MCIAVPSRIISKDNQKAVVDVDGVRREVSLALVPDTSVGDWVIVHAGFAIQVLDEQAAEETLALLREAVAFQNSESGKPKP